MIAFAHTVCRGLLTIFHSGFVRCRSACILSRPSVTVKQALEGNARMLRVFGAATCIFLSARLLVEDFETLQFVWKFWGLVRS